MVKKSANNPLNKAMSEARRGLMIAAAFSFFQNLLVLVIPLYLFQIYDRVVATGRVETLVALTVIAIFALLIMGVLHLLRGRILMRISTWIESTLGASVISATVSAAITGQSVGTEGLRELGQIRNFLASPAMYPVFDAPWTFIFIAVIWGMHPSLGVYAIVGAVVLLVLAVIGGTVTKKPLEEANRLNMKALEGTGAAMRNVEVVQGMGMLSAVIRRWNRNIEGMEKHMMVGTDRSGFFTAATVFFRQSLQIGILAVGAWLVIHGEMSGGGMIVGSILLGRALGPVEQAVSSWKGFVNIRTSFQRLQKLLESWPEETQTTQLPAPEGRVAFEQVVFAPPGASEAVLKNVGFELPAGEVMAVIGPSASGKSTLCRLMVGIWMPRSGHVRLDGADVYRWNREDFGRYVGYLPQDVELFAGSIRDNIARMRDGVSDEAVVEAAWLAGCHDMILQFPDGYDTEVGPGGTSISGGQRQRIGLARAVFGSPKLIVLDEPDSNLDQEGEAALVQAVRLLKERGSTAVLVTHRRSFMRDVDRVLVMYDGQVAMFGARDEVLKKLQRGLPAAQKRKASAIEAASAQAGASTDASTDASADAPQATAQQGG